MRDMAFGNLRTYSAPLVIRHYRKAADLGLQQPEEAILCRLRNELCGKRLLDVGVGGGRTTPYLIEISRDYVGIDYSPQMVEQSRKRHPGVEFRVCDVRDLSQFGDGSFEFVFFSFNGIDYIGPDDRIGALCEIYRVLSNGGAFAFSSHNRNAPRRAAWSPAHLPLNINPLRKPQSLAFQLVRYPLGIFNRLVNRRHERQTGAYELRNDEALEYSLITYYIHVADQVRQLEEARFQDCRAIDLSGRWLEAGDFPNARDHWIYYLCRRG